MIEIKRLRFAMANARRSTSSLEAVLDTGSVLV
jgi:hypothetical protein